MRFGVNQRCQEGTRVVDEPRPPAKSALFDDRLEGHRDCPWVRVPAGEAVSRSFTRSWICSLEAFAAFDAGHVLDLLVARVLLRGRDHVATVVELPRD